jgi:hypothetical protein
VTRVVGAATVLTVLLSGGVAEGQSVSVTKPSGTVEEAKIVADLLKKGAEAYRKRQYAKALESLETAWSLKKSAVIASMLAEVEMNLQQYDVAARHWAYASANFREASKDALKESAAGLAECKTHLATLRVKLTPPDALLVIDGRPVDVQSTGMETWISPGVHNIRAVHEKGTSNPEQKNIDVRAGDIFKIDISALEIPPVTLNSSVLGPVGTVTTASGGNSGLEPRTVVALVGGGLTLTALGVGGLFALKRADANERLDGIISDLARIRKENGGEMVCLRSSPPVECAEASSTIAEADKATNRANLAFGLSAVIGIATVVTYILWPNPTKSASVNTSTTRHHDVVVAPWLTQHTQGMGLQVTF